MNFILADNNTQALLALGGWFTCLSWMIGIHGYKNTQGTQFSSSTIDTSNQQLNKKDLKLTHQVQEPEEKSQLSVTDLD